MSMNALSPPSYGNMPAAQPAQPQARPAPGAFQMPQGQFQMPGQQMPPAPMQPPAMSPQGVPPPPMAAPPPGGVQQDLAYRQMQARQGAPAMAKTGPNKDRVNSQMAYAEKFGTGYDPRGSMSWMQNPSNKDIKSMAKVNALRSRAAGQPMKKKQGKVMARQQLSEWGGT